MPEAEPEAELESWEMQLVKKRAVMALLEAGLAGPCL